MTEDAGVYCCDCATLTPDGEGLRLLAPCYVLRTERLLERLGTLKYMRQRFIYRTEGAGLVALSWFEGIEEVLRSLNLRPFEDAAGYLPSGHRLSIPGVYLRVENGAVVVRRERISATRP